MQAHEKAGDDGRVDARGAWFAEARFAMFIHWGIYSEAGGEWQGRLYHGAAEWLMYRARIPVEQYAQLADRFNPIAFDARAWVRLAMDAGMKYIVITAKHHDGFAMFASRASAYNVVDATPFKRDPLAELAEACREAGLKLGFYYSQYQDWHESDAAGNTWDFAVPGDFETYLRDKARPQIEELLTHYGPIALIWFDTPGDISREASQELLDTIRKFQPDCLVNSRIGNGLGDYSTLGDQHVPLTPPEGLWETIDTHNDSWGYARHDRNWKSPRTVIGRLTRIVSLGGNYMPNVGPTGSGEIPGASAVILREVGDWLRRNGESIYGAGRSPVGMQPWGCCTLRNDVLYLHVIHWPAGGELWIPCLGAAAREASFLGAGDRLTIGRNGDHACLTVPASPPDEPVCVIRVTLSTTPPPVRPGAYVHPGLETALAAPFASLRDCDRGKHRWMEQFGDHHYIDAVEHWHPGSEASWAFTVLRTDRYDVLIDYECPAQDEGAIFEIAVAGQRWTFPVIGTGAGMGARKRLRRARLGMVMLPEGPLDLTLKAVEINADNAILVEQVTLAPFV